MIEKKTTNNKSPIMANTTTAKQAPANNPLNNSVSSSLFNKENYMLMLVGLIVIAIGMTVMSGGKSNDPNVFNQKEVYSTTRITIAPLLIVIGLAIEVFAIFKKPKIR
jgi:hypothetical protein